MNEFLHGGSPPSSQVMSSERASIENPGSLGDLDLQPVSASTIATCNDRSVWAFDQLRISGRGFRPGSEAQFQLIDSEEKIFVLRDHSPVDSRGSIEQRVAIPRRLTGIYGIEAIGTGLDGATRILVDLISLPLRCLDEPVRTSPIVAVSHAKALRTNR